MAHAVAAAPTQVSGFKSHPSKTPHPSKRSTGDLMKRRGQKFTYRVYNAVLYSRLNGLRLSK